MRLRLFRKCTIFCPTLAGSLLILAIVFLTGAVCFIYGESYLTVTHRLPADVLVVEGWIGRAGVDAAVDEFKRGGYRYIVASGGLTADLWEDNPKNFAEMAADEIIRMRVPGDCVLVAASKDTESHRTFESAVAVWRTLHDRGIRPRAINVFTLGPHARRSALVFAKVYANGPEIGVIGWTPSDYQAEPWWKSSERAREFFEETLGFLFEVLFNSGRHSNSPVERTAAERGITSAQQIFSACTTIACF